jgi:hypothetical protein
MGNFIAWEDNQDLSESVETPVPIASDMTAAGSAEAALAQHCEPHHELPKDETVINTMAIRISEVRFAPIAPQEATAAASANMLVGEINCALAGISSVSAPLCVQLHAVDTAANECVLLAAKTERLLNNQAAYRFKLEFEVPPVGHYRLQIVAFLLQADPVIAIDQGPILRVLP